MQAITSEIIEISGDAPGPTLAVFAGVHGDETAGVFALQEMVPTLTIPRGTLLIAFANPPAIAANVRMVAKNLNRCFLGDNDGDTYEDQRARELMTVLDRCDALLDLHMFYDPEGRPFVICEDNALEIAGRFDADIISTNWTATEPGGTDGYMFTRGKIGICVECGPIAQADEYKDFAARTIQQFLQSFGMANTQVGYSTQPKRLVRASHAVHKSSEEFTLAAGFHDFDRLAPGQLIATDGDKKYTAKAGECIIFPHYHARLDEEAYIIGHELAGP